MKLKFLCLLIVFCLFISSSQALSLSGLIAYYSFSGNANDSGNYGYNGTVSGATLTQDRFGYSNSAYEFSNDYISLPYMSQLNTNSMTVGVWIYLTSTTDVNQVIEGHVNGGEFYVETTAASNTMRYSIAGVGSLSYNIPVNSWVYLTTVAAPDKQQFYVNGNLVAENLLTNASFSLTTGFTLGRDHEAEVQYFNGKIDDVIFYQRALTSTEIFELYNSVDPIPETSTMLSLLVSLVLVRFFVKK